ncbi:MAG: AarF/ABC1/UbiB kinase family protein [Chloroflexi bacterium]|nr:AarF/ABC1/UbiB kinase family protein [Chloroflexota bacterium]
MSNPLPFRIRQPYEDIVRLRQITEVLLRNGLGFLIEQLDLTRFLPPWRQRKVSAEDRANRYSVPERVRHTLEELGPTFIKLGQILSTRPDLLPSEYIEELSKLLDAAPPIPASEILAELERELGAPAQDLFAHFEAEPIASASIGQAHRATLKNGETVIVKIQRPGIERVIEADLDLLRRQARFLEHRLALAREYRLSELVDEFGQTLREELDYSIEGRNTDRLRHNLQQDTRVIVPRVYWDLTTRRIITTQELRGYKLLDLERLKKEGYDLPAIAEIIVDVYLKQVFVDGFFHADPHPANILICDEQIGFVDFGMMGYLTPTTKGMLADLLVHTLNEDVDQLTQAVIRLGAIERYTNFNELRRDIQRLLFRYYGLALEEVHLGEFLEDIMTIAFRHRIHLPADLALLARTVVVLEGVARTLSPDFVLVDKARPFVQRLISEQLSLQHLGARTMRTLREIDQLVQVLPQRLDRLSSQLEQGDMTLGIDLRHLQNLLLKLDRVANRLSFSILVAALIIGSALIILGGEAASVWRLPVIGVALPIAQISFVLAGILAAWLLLSIIRSKGL